MEEHPPDRSRHTVLVIEDTEWFGRFLIRDLHNAGFKAILSTTWKDGQEHLPLADALLLDLWLPDGHGHEILEVVLKRNPNLPVIILSADRSIGTYRDSLARGAVMHFGKDQYPRQREELFAHLDAHIMRGADPFQVDLEAGLLLYRGHVVPLSRREFRLASYFLAHPNQLISEETLREEAFGARVEGESVVRTAISRLRSAVKRSTGEDFPLDTLKRRGYYYKRSNSLS